MAKFVPDVRSNRWVVIAPARVTRPHDNVAHPVVGCPFCPENDYLNAEIYRVGDPWQIRVIKNKFPITDYHEVIIHSPDHKKDIDQLPVEQVELILKTYRERYNVNKKLGTVMLFNNHDIHAGASLSHPHSQLVVVPKQINLDAMKKEPVGNVVVQSSEFVAYCPDFSQWPYEIWIAPNATKKSPCGDSGDSGKIQKMGSSSNVMLSESLENVKSQIKGCGPDGNRTRGIRLDESIPNLSGPTPQESIACFGDITDEEISDLAPLLQKILGFICKKFSGEDDVPYNYYIYHGADWYLRIIPRLVHRAGFELGTGLSVNIVDPTMAAQEYRREFEI